MTFEEEQALIDSSAKYDDAGWGGNCFEAWKSACERAEAEKRAAEVARQFLQAEIARLQTRVEDYQVLISNVRALLGDDD